MKTFGILDLYDPEVHGTITNANGKFIVLYTYTPKQFMNNYHKQFIQEMNTFYKNTNKAQMKWIQTYTSNNIIYGIDKTYLIKILQKKIRKKLYHYNTT